MGEGYITKSSKIFHLLSITLDVAIPRRFDICRVVVVLAVISTLLRPGTGTGIAPTLTLPPSCWTYPGKVAPHLVLARTITLSRKHSCHSV